MDRLRCRVWVSRWLIWLLGCVWKHGIPFGLLILLTTAARLADQWELPAAVFVPEGSVPVVVRDIPAAGVVAADRLRAAADN